MFDGTAEKDLRAEVVEVRYPMATLFVGLQRAFKNEGYDADAYDFSSALDEALSNPSCYKRWRHKKRAFNKDLVAEEPGGMHSARNEHPEDVPGSSEGVTAPGPKPASILIGCRRDSE